MYHMGDPSAGLFWSEPELPHITALVAFTRPLTNRLSSIHSGKAIMSLKDRLLC